MEEEVILASQANACSWPLYNIVASIPKVKRRANGENVGKLVRESERRQMYSQLSNRREKGSFLWMKYSVNSEGTVEGRGLSKRVNVKAEERSGWGRKGSESENKSKTNL